MNPRSSSITAFGPIGTLARICQIELAKYDFVAPDLAEEILEDLDRQLFARASPIAKAEWSEAGVITDRVALAVNDPEDGAEAAIGDIKPCARLSPRNS